MLPGKSSKMYGVYLLHTKTHYILPDSSVKIQLLISHNYFPLHDGKKKHFV